MRAGAPDPTTRPRAGPQQKESKVNEQQANIYRNGTVWAYALFIDGEFDSSESLQADSEAGAFSEVAEALPGAVLTRVPDVDIR